MLNKNQDDEVFFGKLFEEMKEGIHSWHKPFCALLAHEGNLISVGLNTSKFENDPTCHAEIQAIRFASKRVARELLGDCTLYTSCEPCLMCLWAIYWAKIPRVVYCLSNREIEHLGFPQFASNIWDFYAANWISVEPYSWDIVNKVRDIVASWTK